MSLFVIFKFSAVPSPVHPDAPRERNPDDRYPASARGNRRGHCRRDITGVQDKVREEQIPEQSRMVSPSVAQGYRLCYTREYHQ
ncbi:unnamed protein product [Staurois parvus]|uniref:Uncharacterized protein n=1 Tax=Staurois parvus TaxID=386267 RepID=A0ABN9EHT2_9NEOB|nr:unnamed protein product [Staurois parvus]